MDVKDEQHGESNSKIQARSRPLLQVCDFPWDESQGKFRRFCFFSPIITVSRIWYITVVTGSRESCLPAEQQQQQQ